MPDGQRPSGEGGQLEPWRRKSIPDRAGTMHRRRDLQELNMKIAVLPALLLLAVQPADAQRPRAPVMRVGACVRTTIARVTQRLEDGNTHRLIADSGSAVEFANGLYQVSYDQVPAVNRARRGGPVVVCRISRPQHWPPGDVRGKLYTTTNFRPQDSWSLPDAEH